MSDFSSRDPAQPAFWDDRFAAQFTPWDAGGVPPAFERWLAAGRFPVGTRLLIPGCGSAYEAARAAAAGCDVLALDFSAAAIARARKVLPPALADRVLRQGDFFDFGTVAFDGVYERAFLAALPPAQWRRWARRMAELLRTGGSLFGLFFVEAAVSSPRRGPPFAATAAELDDLLSADFACETDELVPAAESLPVFAGRERWQQWRRR